VALYILQPDRTCRGDAGRGLGSSLGRSDAVPAKAALTLGLGGKQSAVRFAAPLPARLRPSKERWSAADAVVAQRHCSMIEMGRRLRA
jgi:hypothetical protein